MLKPKEIIPVQIPTNGIALKSTNIAEIIVNGTVIAAKAYNNFSYVPVPPNNLAIHWMIATIREKNTIDNKPTKGDAQSPPTSAPNANPPPPDVCGKYCSKPGIWDKELSRLLC